jgi:16S rRNA (uracil1498-N3)-methyltransferase
MPRFYCPLPLSCTNIVDLPEKVAHHVHVLRLQIGDEITLFNGQGGEFLAKISHLSKKQAQVTIESFNDREAEPAYPVTLAQALPEGSKMDWILEKATELGATHIQPLAAQRCVVKLNAERAEKKQAHWQGILVSAAEQSGRNRIPQLADTISVKTWLTQKTDQPRILLSPRATQSLAQWTKDTPPQPVTIMIGPEGGFTPEEEQLALDQGAIALSMGPRILRTETAGLAVIAVMNAVWEQT